MVPSGNQTWRTPENFENFARYWAINQLQYTWNIPTFMEYGFIWKWHQVIKLKGFQEAMTDDLPIMVWFHSYVELAKETAWNQSYLKTGTQIEDWLLKPTSQVMLPLWPLSLTNSPAKLIQEPVYEAIQTPKGPGNTADVSVWKWGTPELQNGWSELLSLCPYQNCNFRYTLW